MDYYDGNLQTYLKEKRKEKSCIPRQVIKLFSFQMFKALYYLQVLHSLSRATIAAIET